jgi:ubiquinone/menaquinone biosynthesis C-methylase UbiE
VHSIRFVVADAMDLSCFAPRSFDAAYSLTAIKHFPEPVRGLRECLRVLVPGGRLYVSEIRRESSLDEVRALVDLFHAPRWLRGLLTGVVHGNLRDECPPLAEVGRWLAELDGPEAAVPHPLAGRPAWSATLTARP